MNNNPGHVIFLNGTSSSGKTSIAKELQHILDQAFFHISLDDYLNKLPNKYLENQQYMVQALPNLLHGFNCSTAAIARAGNNLIIDHVLQEPGWLEPCAKAFTDIDVIFVAVRCPLNVLEKREQARKDRQSGLAQYQFERVHKHNIYDIEIDTSKYSIEMSASLIMDYLTKEIKPTAFDQIRCLYEHGEN